jgi:SH3-like domain-containing protein
LRQTPAGKILGYLPEGSPVQILYRREMVDQNEWIEVRDLLGRDGWVLTLFLAIRP